MQLLKAEPRQIEHGRGALEREHLHKGVFMASFPKCVSYRLPMRIGAALALSLAVPAFGQDSPPAGSSAQQAATADNAGSKESAERKAAGPELIVVTGGSVRERANAQETEDLSLPELPTAPDGSAAGK